MTEPLLSFDPVFSYGATVIVLLALLSFVIWVEWRRPLKFKSWRLLAGVLLIISLAGILFVPSIRSQRSSIVIVKSVGFQQHVLDSLQSQFRFAEFYTSSQLDRTQAPNKLAEMNASSVLVVGNGLSAAEADLLHDVSLQFFPGQIPEGIIDLQLPDHPVVNRRNFVEGVCNVAQPSFLVLEGPGGKEDSVHLSKNGKQNFRISFTPRETGQITYQLRLNQKREKLPIQVYPQTTRKIIFIQYFPTFETRYLKAFLSKKNRLTSRYQVSKNNFRFEFINAPATRIDRLSTEMLNTFDLLVVDSDAFSALSSNEEQNIIESVRNGLGVLFLFNESPLSNRKISNWLKIDFEKVYTDSAHVKLFTHSAVPFSAWPAKPTSGDLIQVIQNNSRVLSGYRYLGLGKIGFQLLQETYRLQLEGDSLGYQKLWNEIVAQTSRTDASQNKVRLITDFPVYPNQPVEFEIISSTEKPTLLHNNVTIPLKEDERIDDVWYARVWPDEPGWHEVKIAGDSVSFNYFVSENGAWSSLEGMHSVERTKRMAQNSNKNAELLVVYKPLSKLAWYILFILVAGFLWLAPKL